MDLNDLFDMNGMFCEYDIVTKLYIYKILSGIYKILSHIYELLSGIYETAKLYI